VGVDGTLFVLRGGERVVDADVGSGLIRVVVGIHPRSESECLGHETIVADIRRYVRPHLGESDFDTRSALLNQQKSDFDTRCALLNQQKSDFDTRPALLNQQKSDFDTRSALLNQQKSDFDTRPALLNQQGSDFDMRYALLNRQGHSVR
jgi:hypothetical protein